MQGLAWIGILSMVASASARTGKMTMQDQGRAANRTKTIEIKDVGGTMIEIPDEAKKKLE